MSEQKKEFAAIANVTNSYLPMIERALENNSIDFNEYSRRCVVNAITAINATLDANNLTFGDKSLDQSNITSILLDVAALELNASAQPSECFFQIRNVNTKRKDENGKDIWKKKVEMGIQGDGYDAILSRFGRGVKKVYPYWEVREDDDFEYPHFNGLSMTAPKWTPKGTGKVVRVVYPILYDDNIIHFHISERADVKKNLLAHINQNLMNATFGIAKSRYDAKPDELKKIDQKKRELKTKAGTLTLEQILENEELQEFISPSWKEDFSSETMVIRKMRNNITRKIPKDFGSSYVAEKFEMATNESYANIKQEIIEATATEVIGEIAPPEQANTDEKQTLDNKTSDTTLETENVSMGEIESRVKPDFS